MEHRIGFGPRFGAYLLDILIVVGIGFVLALFAESLFERFVDYSAISDEQFEQLQSIYGDFADVFFVFGASVVFTSFFYNLLEGFTGYTPGKLIVGLKVGNQDGTPAETGRLMTRFALKNSSTVISIIALVLTVHMLETFGSIVGFVIFIGCFLVLGEKKLALHDMIAKTAVFNKKKLEDGTAAKPMFDE
jgi:uncharacterized RDD family membrane protein YckC